MAVEAINLNKITPKTATEIGQIKPEKVETQVKAEDRLGDNSRLSLQPQDRDAGIASRTAGRKAALLSGLKLAA